MHAMGNCFLSSWADGNVVECSKFIAAEVDALAIV